MESALRIVTLLLFGIRFVYWKWTETKADRTKQKTRSRDTSRWLFDACLGILVILQLVGVSLFPFTTNIVLQLLGFFFVLVGITVSIEARRTLGANWAHAVEYQIKKDHDLVTQSIYQYIRHPIYAGYYLSLIGAELIVGSYLIFGILLALPIVYTQGKREEKILEAHFGKKYTAYKKKSKMLIPFVW